MSATAALDCAVEGDASQPEAEASACALADSATATRSASSTFTPSTCRGVRISCETLERNSEARVSACDSNRNCETSEVFLSCRMRAHMKNTSAAVHTCTDWW